MALCRRILVLEADDTGLLDRAEIAAGAWATVVCAHVSVEMLVQCNECQDKEDES
jgi:hypothetical protein